MRHKNTIIILDTETTGSLKTPIIYDIGWAFYNKRKNIVDKKEYLVKEVFNNDYLMNSAYYVGKKPLYEQRVKNKKIVVKSFRAILQELIQDIKKYNVKVFSAYNVAFDLKAINSTIDLVCSDLITTWNEVNKRVKPLCIWGLATNTLMNSIEYQELALKKGWYTKNNNILSNAEVAYRYLTGNYEFVEKHTALQDVLIEREILKHCLKSYGGNAKYGVVYHAWRNVQPKQDIQIQLDI